MISIWTDGSSTGTSRGAIGWGWLIVSPDSELLKTGYGGQAVGSNQIAELMAAREGLRAFLESPLREEYGRHQVELVSDSQYTLGLANGSFTPSVNVELATQVRELAAVLRAQTRWVPGHSGLTYNEMADVLAKLGKSLYSEKEPGKREKVTKSQKRSNA